MATLFVDKIDPQSGTSLEIGSSGDTITKGSGVVSRLGVFESQLLHIQDQKAYNAHGGSNVVGDQIRDLNTVITNEITGASLSSNQITLPAGTYYIQASAPAQDVGRHRIFLYNVTDTNIDILGSNEYMSVAVQTRSFINQRFTIATGKTFEIKHYTAIVQATNGLGINDDGGGRTSIYTNVEIWRTA